MAVREGEEEEEEVSCLQLSAYNLTRVAKVYTFVRGRALIIINISRLVMDSTIPHTNDHSEGVGV